jgi:hypothetical protein
MVLSTLFLKLFSSLAFDSADILLEPDEDVYEFFEEDDDLPLEEPLDDFPFALPDFDAE